VNAADIAWYVLYSFVFSLMIFRSVHTGARRWHPSNTSAFATQPVRSSPSTPLTRLEKKRNPIQRQGPSHRSRRCAEDGKEWGRSGCHTMGSLSAIRRRAGH
jgi:hypothetical protein